MTRQTQILILFLSSYGFLTLLVGIFRMVNGLTFLPPIEILLFRILVACVLTYFWKKRIFG